MHENPNILSVIVLEKVPNGLIFFIYFYDILFLLSILSLMEDKSLFVEIRIATKWS